jgi:HPt (histidine-containing phosphotransfer) domain-containing protein
MSATKQLRKALPNMTAEQIAEYRSRLEQAATVEKNPMIRSSYRQQIEIIDSWRSREITVCKCGKCGGTMTVPAERPHLDAKCRTCGDFRSTSKFATA